MATNTDLFLMTHKELEQLVVTFQSSRDIVTNVYERYLVYEAYKRHVQNIQPFNLKWIEFTLKLSFPKVLSLANNLIANGFLIKEKSSYDKRVNNLKPTKKLIDGIELFESMKMNELFIQNVEINYVDGLPCLSDLSMQTKDEIKEKYLEEWRRG